MPLRPVTARAVTLFATTPASGQLSTLTEQRSGGHADCLTEEEEETACQEDADCCEGLACGEDGKCVKGEGGALCNTF